MNRTLCGRCLGAAGDLVIRTKERQWEMQRKPCGRRGGKSIPPRGLTALVALCAGQWQTLSLCLSRPARPQTSTQKLPLTFTGKANVSETLMWKRHRKSLTGRALFPSTFYRLSLQIFVVQPTVLVSIHTASLSKGKVGI